MGIIANSAFQEDEKFSLFKAIAAKIENEIEIPSNTRRYPTMAEM